MQSFLVFIGQFCC